MTRISQLVVSIFLVIFILGGCGFTGEKRRVGLSDNRLTVPLAESVPHTRGDQYSLYRILNQNEDDSRHAKARIPKSSFFAKEGHVILVDPSSVAKSREFDGTVTFDLPLDPQLPENCFVVVNDDSQVTPLSGTKSFDAKYLIGLVPFGAMIEWLTAKEGLRSTKLRITEASTALPRNPAFIGGQCIRREVKDPPKPPDFMTPSKAEQVAKESVFQSMTAKLGCEKAIHLIRNAGILGLLAGALICGESNHGSATTGKLLDSISDSLLFSCAAKFHPLCIGGLFVQLKQHVVRDTKNFTQELSQPYWIWKQEGDQLRRTELNEYTNCREMLEITNSASSTITAINRSIATAEQNLEGLNSRKTLNGTYEFDEERLSCNRTLSSYIKGTWWDPN